MNDTTKADAQEFDKKQLKAFVDAVNDASQKYGYRFAPTMTQIDTSVVKLDLVVVKNGE